MNQITIDIDSPLKLSPTAIILAAETTANALREAQAFIDVVAAMRPDGEGVDSEGSDWIMENDDAVDTLCSLIYQARNILGQKQDQSERWNT